MEKQDVAMIVEAQDREDERCAKRPKLEAVVTSVTPYFPQRDSEVRRSLNWLVLDANGKP